MNDILLSIVIPVYNVEKYLNQCLNSIINQNSKSIEVIIVNDGSTDASGSICKNYVNSYSNIIYIEQNNMGLSEARNAGIRKSTGKYILFLDSDDYLGEKTVIELLSILVNCNSDFILGKAKKVNDNQKIIEHFSTDYSKVQYSNPTELFKILNSDRKFWFAAWLLIINREFLINHNLFFKKGIYHEDELWVPQVFVKAESIYLWNNEFYSYRFNRSNSIINSVDIKKAFDRIIVMDGLEKLASQYPQKKDCIQDRLASLEWGLINLCDQFIGHIDYNSLCKKIDEKVKYLKYKKYNFVYLFIRCFGLDLLIYLLKMKKKLKRKV